MNDQDPWIRLQRVQRFSRLMDASFRIPVIGVRFGIDGVIGLVPVIGDSATAIASLWVIHQAHQAGVPKRMLLKMAGNLGIDWVGGIVPVAGTVFDIYWKANVRNSQLLEQHLRRQLDQLSSLE